MSLESEDVGDVGMFLAIATSTLLAIEWPSFIKFKKRRDHEKMARKRLLRKGWRKLRSPWHWGWYWAFDGVPRFPPRRHGRSYDKVAHLRMNREEYDLRW